MRKEYHEQGVLTTPRKLVSVFRNRFLVRGKVGAAKRERKGTEGVADCCIITGFSKFNRCWTSSIEYLHQRAGQGEPRDDKPNPRA